MQCKSTKYQSHDNKFCDECGKKSIRIDDRYLRIFKVCKNNSCENFDQEILWKEIFCQYCSTKLLLLGEKSEHKEHKGSINNSQIRKPRPAKIRQNTKDS